MRFNTAISALMIFVNEAGQWKTFPKETAQTYAILLSPFAPHVEEEIWSRLGNTETLAYEEWPAFNEEYLKEDVIETAAQVNGKVRDHIQAPAEKMHDKAYGLELARKQKNVRRDK